MHRTFMVAPGRRAGDRSGTDDRAWSRTLRAAAALAAMCAAGTSSASIFEGETLDMVANIMSWVVLVIVPIVLIVVFWMVHVLPEKIAHKNHHPQLKGIQTLCLLSLVFGGLLWPLAWLWAYTKPIGYKMAYGTDLHEDFFAQTGAKWRAGELSDLELRQLRAELDSIASRGALTPALRTLREEIAAAEVRSGTIGVVAVEPRSA